MLIAPSPANSLTNRKMVRAVDNHKGIIAFRFQAAVNLLAKVQSCQMESA